MRKGLVYLFVLIFHIGLGQSDYRFNNYTINEGLSQSLVSCIIQDDLYSLWVGTQDGLNRFDGTDFQVFNSNNTKGIINEFIRCAAKSANGDLWFGTNNGLLKYSISTEEFTAYPGDGLLQVQDLIIEGSKIWVGAAESGLFMFDMNNQKYEPLGNKVKGKFITDLYMTDKNILYIFSEDQGLVSYDKEMQKVKKISLPEGIKVNKVIPDNERSLFLLTTSGIYALDIRTGETKKAFTNLKSTFS